MTRHKTLDQLKPKDKVRIVKISAKMRLRNKLTEMGVLPGVIVEMVRSAPLGDPIDIKIKGYHLSIRKSEAKDITIEPIR